MSLSLNEITPSDLLLLLPIEQNMKLATRCIGSPACGTFQEHCLHDWLAEVIASFTDTGN